MGGSNYDVAYSIQQTTDGGYIVAGSSNSNDGDVSGNHGGRDFWIVKLKPDNLGISDMGNKDGFSFYPNPVHNTLTVTGISPDTKLIITGLNGEIIQISTAKDSTATIDVSGLPAGVYLLNGKKFIKK